MVNKIESSLEWTQKDILDINKERNINAAWTYLLLKLEKLALNTRWNKSDSSRLFLQEFKDILAKNSENLESEKIMHIISWLIQKRWVSMSPSLKREITMLGVNFCNKTRMTKDGWVLLMHFWNGSTMHFWETAIHMRNIINQLETVIRDAKDIGDIRNEKAINTIKKVFAIFQQYNQKLTNTQINRAQFIACEQTKQKYKSHTKSQYNIWDIVLETHTLYASCYPDASNAHFNPQINKIPIFVEGNENTKMVSQKLLHLRQSSQDLRKTPDVTVIQILPTKNIWLVIRVRNTSSYDCSLFLWEPTQEDLNKLNETLRPISNSHISRATLPIHVMDRDYALNDTALWFYIANTLYPWAPYNSVIVSNLAIISLTQPEHIIKEAYTLCGLDYQDFQYQREEIKTDAPTAPRKSDDLDDGKVVRYYPYQDRSKRNQEVRQWVQHLAEGERKSEESGKSPVAHKVLLPAKKKPDGTIQSYKPTPRSQEITKELGFELRKWIQLFDTNEVIYPENIPEMLQILERATVEDAVDFLNEWVPKGQLITAIRYETVAVPQQKSPEAQAVINLIYARVRNITDRNRFSEPHRKS